MLFERVLVPRSNQNNLHLFDQILLIVTYKAIQIQSSSLVETSPATTIVIQRTEMFCGG